MYDEIVKKYLKEVGKYSFNVDQHIKILSNQLFTHIIIIQDSIVFLKEKRKKLEYETAFLYDLDRIEIIKGFFRAYDYSIEINGKLLKFSIKGKSNPDLIDNLNNKISESKPPLYNENGQILARYNYQLKKYIISSREPLVGWYYRLKDYDKAKKKQNEHKWEGKLTGIKFELEPDNEYDKNAISVYASNIKVGYLAKESLAKEKLKPILESDKERLFAEIIYDYDSEEKQSENFMIIGIKNSSI